MPPKAPPPSQQEKAAPHVDWTILADQGNWNACLKILSTEAVAPTPEQFQLLQALVLSILKENEYNVLVELKAALENLVR